MKYVFFLEIKDKLFIFFNNFKESFLAVQFSFSSNILPAKHFTAHIIGVNAEWNTEYS